MFIKGTPEPATHVIPAKNTGKGTAHGFPGDMGFQVGVELIGKTKIYHILH